MASAEAAAPTSTSTAIRLYMFSPIVWCGGSAVRLIGVANVARVDPDSSAERRWHIRCFPKNITPIRRSVSPDLVRTAPLSGNAGRPQAEAAAAEYWSNNME